MKKSFYALFFMVICLFSFCGCGQIQSTNMSISEKNAFRILRQANASGQIALSYIFPVNADILLQNGFDEKEIKTYRFYLTTYVNALAKINKEKEIEGVKVGSCVYFSDVDGLGFTIQFDDINAQKRYFGIEDDEGNNQGGKQSASGFFIKKLEIKTTFPVSSTKSAGDLKMVCSMAISSWCSDNNISSEKKETVLESLKTSVYIYDFSNQDNILKSEKMYQDGVFYHNVFVKTLSDIESDNQIVFWITSVNKPVWYIFALFIVCTGMFVAFVILKQKSKKTKYDSK